MPDIWPFAPPRRRAIMLGQERGGLFLILLTSVLVCLACLAMAAASVMEAWRARLAAAPPAPLTLEIPLTFSAFNDGAPAQERKKRKEQMVKKLSAHPAIRAVLPLEETQADALLAPWLDEKLRAALPLPLLLDIDIAPATWDDPATREKFIRWLTEQTPGARLHDQGLWLNASRDLLALIGGICAGLILLAALGTMACGFFLTGALLAFARPAAELLRQLGAEDDHIARQCQHFVFAHSACGSGIGAALALAFLLPLFGALNAMDWPLWPGALTDPGFWLAALLSFLLVPLLVPVLAGQTALWRARRWLARLF